MSDDTAALIETANQMKTQIGEHWEDAVAPGSLIGLWLRTADALMDAQAARDEALAALAKAKSAVTPDPPDFAGLVEAFKSAWGEADTRGDVGKRTEAGVRAVLASMKARAVFSPEDVAAERARTVAKGYTPEHDAEHGVEHLLIWALDYGSKGEPVKAAGLMESAREVHIAQVRALTAERDEARAALDKAERQRDGCIERNERLWTSVQAWGQLARNNGYSGLGLGFERAIDDALRAQAEAKAKATERDAHPMRITYNGLRNGKTQAVIEAILSAANKRGIEVTVVYPKDDVADRARRDALEEAATEAERFEDRSGSRANNVMASAIRALTAPTPKPEEAKP